MAAIRDNERRDLCAACGGLCCRSRPGGESPERFLSQPDPAEALARALSSGNWVLAHRVGVPWVDGKPPPDEVRWRRIRYPRPATVAERDAGAASSTPTGSPCVHLESGGCRLGFEDRPRGCRALEPRADGDCPSSWDEGEAALAWLPLQALVDDAERRRP